MEYLTIRYLETHLGYPVGLYIDQSKIFLDSIFTILKKNKINLDDRKNNINIWCRGSSGAILSALFAQRLSKAKVKIIHIKKRGEYSHDTNRNYSLCPDDIDIVIDDIMASGRTLTRIWNDSKIQKVDFLILSSFNYEYFVNAFKHPEFPRMIPRYIVSGSNNSTEGDISPESLISTDKRNKSTERLNSFNSYFEYFIYCEVEEVTPMSKVDFNNLEIKF